MPCKIHSIAKLFGSKWTFELISVLKNRKKFSELKKSLGKISSKVLIERLNQFQEEGIVEKNEYSYSLTEKGIRLTNALNDLKSFGIEYNLVDSSCKERSCANCTIQK